MSYREKRHSGPVRAYACPALRGPEESERERLERRAAALAVVYARGDAGPYLRARLARTLALLEALDGDPGALYPDGPGRG